MSSFNSLRLTILVLLVLGFYSCKSKKKGYIAKSNPISINLSNNSNSFSLADNIDDLKVICLETSENSIISEAWSIQRILTINGMFFVLDGKYMSIKVFNASGKFLFNVGNLGKGDGEFVRIEDILYYEPHNSLLVLCNSPTKIIEFSLDGRLIRDILIDFYATAFAFQFPDSFVFYVNQNKSKTSGNKNVIITDSLFNVKYTMFDMPKTLTSTIKFSGGIFPINGNIYFNPALSNNYYSIRNDTILQVYQVDYGAKKIPSEIGERELMNNLEKYGFQYNSFIKTKEYVGFNYHNDNVVSIFYNVNTKNILTSDVELDSLNMLFKNLMFQKGDSIISVLNINELSEFINRNYQKIINKFPEFYEKVELSDSSKNPILLIYRLESI